MSRKRPKKTISRDPEYFRYGKYLGMFIKKCMNYLQFMYLFLIKRVSWESDPDIVAELIMLRKANPHITICPECGMYIEKVAGCNQMVHGCSEQIITKFCFRCCCRGSSSYYHGCTYIHYPKNETETFTLMSYRFLLLTIPIMFTWFLYMLYENTRVESNEHHKLLCVFNLCIGTDKVQ